MCFHCKMFPIKKQFREHHINKLLVFRKGQRFWNAGWTNIHTNTYSATRRLLQQHLIRSKLEFVQLRPGERWKTSWLSLEKKHLKFIQHPPWSEDPPNQTQPWPTCHQQGLAKTGTFSASVPPLVKRGCWVQRSVRVLGVLQGDPYWLSPNIFNPRSRKSWLNLKLISNKDTKPWRKPVKPGGGACT